MPHCALPQYEYTIIRVCKYASIKACIMQLCKNKGMYAIMKVYRFTAVEVSTLQVEK